MDTNAVGLLEILDRGERVKLSDGSFFHVDPFDLPEISGWSMSCEIEVGIPMTLFAITPYSTRTLMPGLGLRDSTEILLTHRNS
ncbi:hypothetical protein ACFL3F_04295 [Planctomycetota bacterium]